MRAESDLKSRFDEYDVVVPAPFGGLGVRLEDQCVVEIDFLYDAGEICKSKHSPVARELRDYLKNPSHRWRLDICPHGTAFQQRVWKAMQRIPAGKFKTYGELAAELNSSPRAVGNACRANPIPIIIPCHRVVAKNGPGGFGGQTKGVSINAKQWLLRHEGANV